MIGFLNLLVFLLIFALIIGVLWYAFNLIPLPPIAKTVAIVVLCIVLVIFLISLLTGGLSLPVLIRG